MTAETKSALDDAVAAHIASETEGVMLTGYVLQCAGQSVENLESRQTTMMWDCLDGQPIYVSLGLARALTLNIDDFHTAIDDDED